MTATRIVFAANVLVTGWISISCLFYPKIAQSSVFENAFTYSEAFRLVGALWWAIFILSVIGLFLPKQMSLVLLFQLIYKGSWLLFVALPSFLASQPSPKGMAIFFILWVIVLPFVIPWRELLTEV